MMKKSLFYTKNDVNSLVSRENVYFAIVDKKKSSAL